MAELFVEGLKDLDKALSKLGAQMGVKTLRAAGRLAMKPVLSVAKNNVNVASGDTHDALAISASKGKGKAAVNINVGATKKKATAKQGGRTFAGVNQKVIAQEFGTKKQKAEPFLRPALDNNAQNVLTIFKTQLKLKIEKIARKAAK